jgi:hypothetical protein
VLRLSYNVDFGYISLFEVIGIVAAYMQLSVLWLHICSYRYCGCIYAVIGIVATYSATIPITSNNDM